MRGLRLQGSIRYTTSYDAAAINLIASGKIDVRRPITNRFKFEELERALDLVRDGRPKIFKVMIHRGSSIVTTSLSAFSN